MPHACRTKHVYSGSGLLSSSDKYSNCCCIRSSDLGFVCCQSWCPSQRAYAASAVFHNTHKHLSSTCFTSCERYATKVANGCMTKPDSHRLRIAQPATVVVKPTCVCVLCIVRFSSVRECPLSIQVDLSPFRSRFRFPGCSVLGRVVLLSPGLHTSKHSLTAQQASASTWPWSTGDWAVPG